MKKPNIHKFLQGVKRGFIPLYADDMRMNGNCCTELHRARVKFCVHFMQQHISVDRWLRPRGTGLFEFYVSQGLGRSRFWAIKPLYFQLCRLMF